MMDDEQLTLEMFAEYWGMMYEYECWFKLCLKLLSEVIRVDAETCFDDKKHSCVH